MKYPLIFLKKLQKTLDKIAKKCRPPRYINYFTEAYMQYFSSDQVYSALMSSIDSLFVNRQEFLNNPKSAFTRTKKISFRQAILFPMLAGSDYVATELLDFFGEDNLPLPSAMIQRRNQIKSEAFQELFYEFTQKIPIKETYHGYQLVACDGSRINLPYNPSDSFSFLQSIEGRKGNNQIHLNALYDLLNDIFLDAELQGIHQMHEKAAFCRFLDKHKDSEQKRIYIADRGYASYNVLGHAIHNKQLFLIRASEKYAKGLCSRKGWLCDSFADENITIHIGCRELKQFKEFENFHCVKVQRQYDYSDVNDTRPDKLSFRVLKFPIAEDSYEYILTNLPAYSFSADEIKKLYNLRWGQETAFRHLNYAGNMVHIHSLKKEFIMQEIYAKLVFYNFSAFLASAFSMPKKKTEKHTYVINHTQLQKICIRFLRGAIENVNELILRFLVPVRLGRKFDRNLRRQSADTLAYR